MAARYLHAHSARRDGPFVEVSLTAISPSQVAAQLFGQEQKGSVTPGCFEQAANGTLLLNEIGGLDLAAQARLLNVLEQKRFTRVGGQETIDMDTRILAASDQDLHKAVEEKRFREDLYYRLNVVPLRVPSLREHHEDVPELINFYVNWMADNEHLPYRKFTTGALNLLRNYSWPGNVRELRNVVQRLLILHRGEEVSETEVEQTLGSPAPVSSESYPPTLLEMPLRDARDQFEKAYLEHHLKRTGGNVAEVARMSGHGTHASVPQAQAARRQSQAAQGISMAIVDNLEAMLARGQDSALLRYSLGGEYLKLNQPDKAAEHLRQAVDKDPKYSAAWKLLGKALADAGRNDRSDQGLRRWN